MKTKKKKKVLLIKVKIVAVFKASNFLFIVQEKSTLDNTLQVTMHPDGSFLCFGGTENQGDSMSNDAPLVEVCYNLFEACLCSTLTVRY